MMTGEGYAVPTRALEAFLAEIGQFVVVRNEDIYANLARGGDVDLLVADFDNAEQALLRHLGPPLVVQRRSYVVGYYYRWGYVDLFPTLEWHGAVYLGNAVVFQNSVRSSIGERKPRLAHEALVCWFSSLLWGGFFKERYRELILRAATEDPDAFRHACALAAGSRWGDRLVQVARSGRPEQSVKWVKALRRAVWWQAFRRNPLRTLGRWASFWRHEVALRRKPPLPWVALLGPDGSGKSSVIAEITSRFGPPICAGVTSCHWRPGVVHKPDARSGPVTDPHGKPARWPLTSMLKLGMLLTDWLVGYWGRLVHLRARGTLLVSDRHYLDILVDPRRYRYGGPLWLARLVANFVPAPDVLIVLDAPADVLQRRKDEVSAVELSRLRGAYRELVRSHASGYVVDASQTLDNVASEVEAIILRSLAAPSTGGHAVLNASAVAPDASTASTASTASHNV